MGQRLNVDVMSAHYYGQSIGDTYTFQDYGAPQGETVWYWLEELTDEPATLLHGPVTPGGGPAVMQRTPDTLYYDVYRSYYYLGGQRIAQRRQSPALFLDELLYLFTDHLGTVRLETYGNGPSEGQMRAATPVLPYGGQRSAAPESHHWYTGQYFDRSEDLYDYGARPYDPLLGLFIQADTVVPNPGDPQSLNRYAYTLNNPVRYSDPTGMFSEDEIMEYLGVTTWDDVLAMFGEGGAMAGRWGYLEALRQAQLGTPISMWLNAGTGLQFNIHQPDVTGIFYEQNGDLTFAVTFTNWSGAGGSWSVVGLSVTAASQMLGAAAIYQVGSLGNYLHPNQQYMHLKFDASRVDWLGVGLDATGIVADVVTAGAGGRVINGVQIADVARVAGQTLDVASMFNSGAALAVDVHEGHNHEATLADFGLATAGLYVPVIPDAVSLLWGLSQGFNRTP